MSGQTPIFPASRPMRAAASHPQSASWLRPWRLLLAWAGRRAQRRALADLADLPHRLADVGLTRAQAMREAGKPFWKR
jgi:uncharacterized protein YjiS (DUF1127 family)